MPDPIRLPEKGHSPAAVLARMEAMRAADLRWQEGRVFGLVFFAGEEASRLLKEAYTLFFSENALNPAAFPSLRRFETEVIAMSADLLGSRGEVVGNMTSGGTESILMAVKTARDWARSERPSVRQPEMVLPLSAHPAFDKAAHYFGVDVVRAPLNEALQVDLDAVVEAITSDTILLVGSAPGYPHGVIDPIPDLAALARERDLLLHVDACVGGFMLPFVRRLGYPVTDFDFTVPGVTSLSADLHKYGYAAKGASLILYRDADLRRHQLFAATDWPGGLYASPTMTGTRPGGALAAAWAIMNHLGEEGYLDITRRVMETTTIIREGIEALDGVTVLGDPAMSLMAIASDELDIYEVGDELGVHGWHVDRQHFPPSLHLTINNTHVEQGERFLEDLAAAVAATRRGSVRRVVNRALLKVARAATTHLPDGLVSRLTRRASELVGVRGGTLPDRTAPIYGMMGSLPNRGDVREVVLDLLEQFTDARAAPPPTAAQTEEEK